MNYSAIEEEEEEEEEEKKKKKKKKCKDAPTHLLIRNAFIKLLKTKRRLLYLKIQSVPRCKHFSSRL